MESLENKDRLDLREYSIQDIENGMQMIHGRLIDNFEKMDVFFDTPIVPDGKDKIATYMKTTDKAKIFLKKNLPNGWALIKIEDREEMGWLIDIKKVSGLGYRVNLVRNNENMIFEIDENGQFKFVKIFGNTVIGENPCEDKGVNILDEYELSSALKLRELLGARLDEATKSHKRCPEEISAEYLSFLKERIISFRLPPKTEKIELLPYRDIVHLLAYLNNALKDNLGVFEELMKGKDENDK